MVIGKKNGAVIIFIIVLFVQISSSQLPKDIMYILEFIIYLEKSNEKY